MADGALHLALFNKGDEIPWTYIAQIFNRDIREGFSSSQIGYNT